MECNDAFLDRLNDVQKKVCMSTENYVLTACPGSGKTRTITYRLAYLAKKYKASRKVNIAITYTNRAAEEIESRVIEMGIDTSNIWTGTIHQFCMRFIIRPYSMYHPKLSKGYRIIDELTKDEILKSLAIKMGIKYSYVKELSNNPQIINQYLIRLEKNKEIDFDMILNYSNELVQNNRFIAENIANIIRSIHVDEYQDTNEIQYSILSAIIKVNLKINLLFVGDINQAIYGNLGGVAKSVTEIRKLFSIDFTEECLNGCYRSSQRIVDYYTNFEVISTGAYSVAEIKENRGVIKFNKDIKKEELADIISQIIKDELSKGVLEEEICIVAPQWLQIYPLANRLRKIMPDNNFDAPDISPLKYNPLNIFFLIAKLLFTQGSKNSRLRRREAEDILVILREDYQIITPEKIDKLDVLKIINSTQFIQDNGILTLKKSIENLLNILHIDINKQDNLLSTYNEFFERIDSRIKQYKLEYSCDAMKKSFNERNGIVINTIHGVKGEEYTTIIGFDLLNGHLPHWDYIWNDTLKLVRHEETNKLLYVLCSRAKENLYLFSETGRTTRKGIPLQATMELENYTFDYDI